MYNSDTIHTDFVVDTDLAVKWLIMKKKILLETLYSSYIAKI